MKDNTTRRLGGTCSILVGISYLVLGIAHLVSPAEQKFGPLSVFYASYAQNPTFALIQYWSIVLGALLAIAVVPAVSQIVQAANEGWVRWTSHLAIIGFAVTALDYFRPIAVMSARATAFVNGDAVTKAGMLVPGSFAGLDPDHWMSFGAVGFWVFVVSLLAIKSTLWPRMLAYVGILAALAYWLAVAGFALDAGVLVTVGAVAGGGILGPIWYIWLGLMLRREPAQ